MLCNFLHDFKYFEINKCMYFSRKLLQKVNWIKGLANYCTGILFKKP